MLDERRPVHLPRSLSMLVMVRAVKQRHIPNPNPNPNPNPIDTPTRLSCHKTAPLLPGFASLAVKYLMPTPSPNPVRELKILGEIGGGPIGSFHPLLSFLKHHTNNLHPPW